MRLQKAHHLNAIDRDQDAVKIPVPPRLSTGKVPLVFGAATSRNAIIDSMLHIKGSSW
nr:Uncharacterised protein [Raoultella sp. NCTC 9187]